jgi:outer membrane cobalamin receptor
MSCLTVVLLSTAIAGTPAPSPSAGLAPAPGGGERRPYFVGELVVTDEAEPAEKVTTAAVTEIDHDELVATGATNVAEALEHVPGLFVSTGGRGEAKVWSRGYEQSTVRVLVDGVPISDPYYGDVDLSQLPLSDVARITVARGPASTLYGGDSLGGVINIVTFQGQSGLAVRGEVRGSEHGTFNANANVSGGDGPLHWYVGATRDRSDGFPLADDFEATEYEDGGRRVNSDLERDAALLRVGWDLGEDARVDASYQWTSADKGIPFNTVRPSGFTKFARFPEWEQTTSSIGYQLDRDNLALVASAYHHTFDNVLDSYRDPELNTLRVRSTFNDEVTGLSSVARTTAGRHNLAAAVHLRRDLHRSWEDDAAGARSPTERYRADVITLSLEDRITMSQRFAAVLGVAAERHDVQEATSLRRADDGSTILAQDPLDTTTEISPQAGLLAYLGERLTASATVYRRHRFPTLVQLYGADPPNPNLEPQRTTGVDLGVDTTLVRNRLELSAHVFADRAEDLISRASRNDPYANQDEADLRGLELQLSGNEGPVTWSLAWAWLDAELSDSVEGMQEIPFAPEQALDLSLSAQLTPRTSIRATGVHTGRRVFYDYGVRRELETYTLLHLGAEHELLEARGLVIGADVTNALDENVEQESGFPLPGRRAWLWLRVRP